jgi:hypothetical protein
MGQIHFEIKEKDEIEALGFRYAEDMSRCRGHMFNDIPVEVDIRKHPEYKLEDVEEDMDRIFRKVLEWELKDAQVMAIREITWDRLFFLKKWWEPRDFEVHYWVRVVGEDAGIPLDPHIISV